MKDKRECSVSEETYVAEDFTHLSEESPVVSIELIRATTEFIQVYRPTACAYATRKLRPTYGVHEAASFGFYKSSAVRRPDVSVNGFKIGDKRDR